MNEKFKKKYLKYKKKYLNIQKYMVGGSWRVFPLWTPKSPPGVPNTTYGIGNIRSIWDGGRPVDRYYEELSSYGYTVEMLKVRRSRDIIPAKPPSTPSPPLPPAFVFAPIPTITKHLQDCDTIFGHRPDKIYTIDLEGAAVPDFVRGDIEIRGEDWKPPPGGVAPTTWTKTHTIPPRDELVKMAILDTFKDIEEDGKMEGGAAAGGEEDIFKTLLDKIFFTNPGEGGAALY